MVTAALIMEKLMLVSVALKLTKNISERSSLGS